ncbi:MAG: UDP-N-acetylglucosamine 2-epimerase (non-hydrolyzing) [Clostridia bacterium]|nr:UDP-N-acetylglucosamine 2-epimerase (non-hydrolyzing) [Clostridia bacterium]
MDKKIKVMSVFGTRPEATKMCPLVLELGRRESIESIVCLTGQHREMLDSVMNIFGVKSDYDLNIMKKNQDLYSISADILTGMKDVLNDSKPDLVLVHGDTSTSFVAALSAFYAKIPVGHVEAGLRTYDRYSPFPEEMNRTLTGDIAALHFSPTSHSRENLLREGISENIYITGNTGLDAIRYTAKDDYTFSDSTLNSLDFSSKRFIVLTAHRRENLGQGIENICRAVKRLVEKFDDIEVVYPVHLNPAVRNTVFPILGDCERVHLIDPVDVTDMHNLMKRCYLCLTDSGGLQEEAPVFDLPVLVLRSETERPEAADAGTVKVVGTDEDVIFDEASVLLTDKAVYDKMASAENPYGDGHASEKIADAIEQFFGIQK